jgi:hypothetical protein
MLYCDYLIKSALSKTAGKWDRKIADIIRANPEGQAAQFMRDNLPKFEIGEKTYNPLKLILRKAFTVLSGNKVPPIVHVVNSLLGGMPILEPISERDYTRKTIREIIGKHQGVLLGNKVDTELKRFNDNVKKFKPNRSALGDIIPISRYSRTVVPARERITSPKKESYSRLSKYMQTRGLEDFFVDLPGGSVIDKPLEITTNPAIYNPNKFIYKGTSTVPVKGKNLFASPHQTIAGGYSHEGDLLLKFKTPPKSLFTPHVAMVNKPSRYIASILGKRSGSNIDWANLPDYETVVDLAPKDILEAYRTRGKTLVPQGLRQGKTVVPFSAELAANHPAVKGITDYTTRPVLKPVGFTKRILQGVKGLF